MAKYGKTSFAYQFLHDSASCFESLGLSNIPELFPVTEFDTEEDVANIVYSGRNVRDIISLDSNGNEEYILWEYIPFNYRCDERIKQLIGIMDKEDVDYQKDYDRNIAVYYDQNKDKIKRAFDNLKGSPNTNSMTLFSGVRNFRVRQSVYDLYCTEAGYCYNTEQSYQNGCLYFGDYDSSGIQKWKQLTSAYRDYVKWIGCVQLPHHGSKHNYNPNLANMGRLFIVSAGKKNAYCHPHSFVIKDILMRRRQLYLVAEDIDNQLDIIIRFC